MVFKKSFLTIAALGILVGCSNSKLNLELKIGDPMPDLSKEFKVHSVKTENKTRLQYYGYKNPKKGPRPLFKYVSAISFDSRCKDKMTPFAVQSFEKKEIYMDPDFDGIINHIYTDTPGGSIVLLYHSCKYQNIK